MNNIIRFKPPTKSFITSDSLMGLLLIAALVQIAVCFSAGLDMVAPTNLQSATASNAALPTIVSSISPAKSATNLL